MVEQQGNSLVVTNGPFQQYQWLFNGSPVPGATSSVHNPAQSGNYRVIVTDENGCEGQSFNIEFTFTGIEEASDVSRFDVYPNPTRGEFTLEVELIGSMDVELTVADMVGRNVIEPEQLRGVSQLRRSFDMEALSAGVYLIQIRTASGSSTKRLIKQ
ncbi:MAG: T9SS type A sorting domain-containing protein [Bacteroidetes bacterium]|nr:MAG: T9SS type A sorting domain-containing protein [Bacteroidota bacterium]